VTRLILANFGFATPGTPVPQDFMMPEGLRVVLTAPSRIEMSGTGIGVRIESRATLIPTSAFESVRVRGFAGSDAPTVRFIDPSGSLIKAIHPAKKPDQSFDVGLSAHGPISRIDIDYPHGEGTIYTLAGIQEGEETHFELEAIEILAIDASVCQAIVYAETGTIEVGSSEGLPGLAEARRFIAGAAYKRNGAGVAKPKYPTPDELKQPFIKKAWDRCETAAKDAQGDDVGKCKHFVVWFSDDGGKTPSKKPKEIKDKWPYEQIDKIETSWGPYTVNELGADNIYVIKYCGVP
jgi:hypothetical protein